MTISFDVSQSRIIHNSNIGFGKTEEFRKALASTAEYVEQNGTPGNPVKMRIEELHSGNSEEQSSAAIEKKIDNIFGEVSEMNNKLEEVESRFLPEYKLNDILNGSPSAILFGNTTERTQGSHLLSNWRNTSRSSEDNTGKSGFCGSSGFSSGNPPEDSDRK